MKPTGILGRLLQKAAPTSGCCGIELVEEADVADPPAGQDSGRAPESRRDG